MIISSIVAVTQILVSTDTISKLSSKSLGFKHSGLKTTRTEYLESLCKIPHIHLT